MRVWESLIPYEEATASIHKDDFVELEGRKIHAPQSGSGRPLVLLHGIAASAYSFRMLRPFLEDQFRVVAVDLNGFGYTERPEERSLYHPENQVDQIVEVMEKRGIEKADFLGHSYGAALVVLLTRRHPNRVGNVILLSPAMESKPPPWYLRNRLGLWGCYFAVRLLLSNPEKFREVFSRSYFRKECFDSAAAEQYRRALRVDGLKNAYLGFARAFAGGFPDIPWSEISHRTLVLAGENDEIVDVKSCESLSRRIETAQFAVLENCGHSAPEEQPEALADLIETFCD